uniref:DUF4303 domain-containing protein n=1 Tax=Caenorhabditis tropicalis TaxID=1561998 RepID=A0A1I7THG7_9PELO
MENIKKRAEKPGKYEDINMKTALSEARKDFKRTGDMDFVYGFLVIKPETDDYDLFYEGLGDYCSARYNENRNYGFDTIIQRIPYNLSLALEDNEIVDSIIDALNRTIPMTTDAPDYLTFTTTMGSKMEQLLKNVTSLGSIILRNINPKPESEEYKALEKYEPQSNLYWKDVEGKLRVAEWINPLVALAPFRTVVNPPLVFLMNKSKKFTNPKENKDAEFLTDFYDACRNDRE